MERDKVENNPLAELVPTYTSFSDEFEQVEDRPLRWRNELVSWFDSNTLDVYDPGTNKRKKFVIPFAMCKQQPATRTRWRGGTHPQNAYMRRHPVTGHYYYMDFDTPIPAPPDVVNVKYLGPVEPRDAIEKCSECTRLMSTDNPYFGYLMASEVGERTYFTCLCPERKRMWAGAAEETWAAAAAAAANNKRRRLQRSTDLCAGIRKLMITKQPVY
jgi:hypothetical protein